MRVNKTTLLFVLGLLVILFCIALANTRYISTPRLVIKFHGRPLSNVTLLVPNGGDGPYQIGRRWKHHRPSARLEGNEHPGSFPGRKMMKRIVKTESIKA